jgi:hypothetical protein
MPLHIPLELIGAIVGYLHDDKPALRACALTSRSWVRASQLHIFDSISLDNRGHLDALISLLEDCAHLRPLVRHLSWCPGFQLAPHEFPRAALFPRIRTMFLKGQSKWLDCAFVLGLSSLEKLELGRVTDMMNIDVYRSAHTASSNESGPRQSAGWSVLVLEEIQTHVLEWLASEIEFPQLKTLEIPLHQVDEDTHTLLQRFLTSLKVMHELKMTFEHSLDITRKQTSRKLFRLSHRHISALSFGVIKIVTLRLDVYPDEETVPFISGLLRKTSFPRLRHLCLDIGTSYVGHLVMDGDLHATFNPLAAGRDGSGHSIHNWVLTSSLATQLESVLITLPHIGVLKRARDFFMLFGEANRPEILRVLPESLQLLNDE